MSAPGNSILMARCDTRPCSCQEIQKPYLEALCVGALLHIVQLGEQARSKLVHQRHQRLDLHMKQIATTVSFY